MYSTSHTLWPAARIRRAAVAVLLLTLPACSYWRVHETAPQTLLDARHPERIRVVLDDQRAMVLRHPEIKGDSLIGFYDTTRISVALADVASIAERRTHALKTAGAVYSALAVVALIPGVMDVGYSPDLSQ